MMNENVKKMLQDGYNNFAFTDKYILAYSVKGTVYFTICNRNMVDRVTCLDKASRGAGYSLRFKPNMGQKLMLMAENATCLCSEKLVADMKTESIYNGGEVVEKLITEYFGQEWKKDNVPFTEDGDITINGVAYQIKFEKATFINEKQLMKLRERA